MSDSTERLRYFDGQFLAAEDLRLEQAYHRDGRRRHALGPHTWGIVTGLTLVATDEDGVTQVTLTPGMAVDGYGRALVVRAPFVLSEAELPFADPGFRAVWLAYDEAVARQQSAACRSGATSRLREGWRVLTGDVGDSDDGVEASGSPVTDAPPDRSVPYQDLPDSDTARWLIRLGTVDWDGTAFAGAQPRLGEGRRLAGFVGAHLVAPTGALALRARDEGPFTLTVEGRTDAFGDVSLRDAALRFLDVGGNDGPQHDPISLRRVAHPETIDLQVELGRKEAGGRTRLTVGPAWGDGEFRAALSVPADGPVRIHGDLEIADALAFDEVAGDRLVLWGSADDPAAIALGTPDAGTLGFRAPVRHRWRVGGSDRVTLDSGKLSVSGHLEMVDPGDQIVLGGGAGQPGASAIGTLDAGRIYYRAGDNHRWFTGAVPGQADPVMQLSGLGLVLLTRLSLRGVVEYMAPLPDGDRVRLHPTVNLSTQPAIGVEDDKSVLYHRAGQAHRWYIGQLPDGGSGAVMTADQGGVELPASSQLRFGGPGGDRIIVWRNDPAPAAVALGAKVVLGVPNQAIGYTRAPDAYHWYLGEDDGSPNMALTSEGLDVTLSAARFDLRVPLRAENTLVLDDDGQLPIADLTDGAQVAIWRARHALLLEVDVQLNAPVETAVVLRVWTAGKDASARTIRIAGRTTAVSPVSTSQVWLPRPDDIIDPTPFWLGVEGLGPGADSLAVTIHVVGRL